MSPSSPPMTHRGIGIGALALVSGTVLLQLAGAVRPDLRASVTYFSMVVVTFIGGVFAVRAARGPDRTAWLLVALAQLLTLMANTALGQATATGDRWWFWAGAASGFAMYAAFALAALAFPAQQLRGWQRAALTGESLAVLGCGFMYVWYFVLRPHLAAADVDHWPVSLGFPLGDLLLLIGVTAVVLRGGLTAATRPVALLIAGLSVFLVADCFLSAIGDDGNHTTGPLPATISSLVAAVLITLAAMWQSAVADEPGAPASALRRPWTAAWFSHLPQGAVLLGLALMVAVTVRDGQLLTWGGLVLGLTLVTAGVAVRQAVSLHDGRQHETTDPLTGLTNRVGLSQHLTRAVRRGERVALLLIDLDGFKSVNDTYGHNTGDLLLLEFAAVLRAETRGTDLACRIGGDEFVVLQRDVTEPADALALAKRILATAVASPLRVGEHSIIARASIGAALAVAGDTPDDLRHRADIAMYQAKRAGHHDVVLHEPGMPDRRADDAALGRDLEEAVASGQLRVLYQPMIDLASGRPAGVEALVRWHHPVRGVVSPLDFIPIAERTGAISGVGQYVLEQACRDVQEWGSDGPAGAELYASVNLSARQLQDPSLAAEVLAVLARTGLPPHRLVLEITESAIVDDRIAIPTIEALRAHGIRFALDDFGTGYSSLQYLSRLPVDILKIDRSFVAELDGTRHGSAITEAVIRLAEILELATVAEGIETTAQADEVRRLGCRMGQGFLYARPLPADEARRFVTIHDPVAGAPRGR